MTKKYEIKTLEDMIYYLQYTGDTNGIAKELNTTENVIKAMLLPTITSNGFNGWANVYDTIKCLNQSDAEWMQYLSRHYNKKTIQGVKYYLDYTGDIDGVLREFNLSEEVLMVILLSHCCNAYFFPKTDASMQGILDEMTKEYPQKSSYTGKISEVSTIRDIRNYLKFTDDIDGLSKKFGTTPDIIKALIGAYPDSFMCDWDRYGDIKVEFLLHDMQSLDSSIEKCLRHLHIMKYRYEKAYLYKDPLSKVITMEDLMYYVAYTGDIDGLTKKFSTTPEVLKSMIWNNSEYRLAAGEKKTEPVETTIKKWQEKFEQGFDMLNAGISSVKTVHDMHKYLDITGDMDGLVKQFGISEEEIDEMIWCLSNDLGDVQEVIENPKKAYAIDDERMNVGQQTLIDRAKELMRKREGLCNVGVRPIREFLRKKYEQEKDIDARIFQLAIDIEEKSIIIKRMDWLDYDVPYAEAEEIKAIMAEHKAKLLKKLIQFYRDAGYEYGWGFGCRSFSEYVYFDLPNGEQISFSTYLSKEEMKEIPEYTKEWNYRFHHTLDAIENNLLLKYPSLKNITPPQPKGLIETCSPEMLAIIYGEYDSTSGQLVLPDKLRKKLGV